MHSEVLMELMEYLILNKTNVGLLNLWFEFLIFRFKKSTKLKTVVVVYMLSQPLED